MPVDLCVEPVDLCVEPRDCVVPVDLCADPLDCQFMPWLELCSGVLVPAELDPVEPDPAEPDPPLGGAVVPEPDPPLPGVDVLPALPLDDDCGVSLAGADGLVQP